MGKRGMGWIAGRGMAAGLVLIGCGAAPKPTTATGPVAAPPVIAPPVALAPPVPATVDGYVTAMTDVLDQTADEVCACGELQCSDEVVGRVALRAGSAAISYRLGKLDTPELTALLERMNREDFQFSDYLDKERPRWSAQFNSRMQICMTRIVAASATDDEVGDEADDEAGDEAGDAVKTSYQPAK